MKRLLFFAALWLCSLTAFTQSVDGALKTVVASGTDTYTITEPLPAAYSNKERFLVRFTNANTGAATLNRNDLGAKDIKKADGSALAAGEIAAGATYLLAYNGTYYQLIGGSGGGGGYTDEEAQDAVGGMIDGSLTYVDGTPLLQRAALTGAITASAGSNSTSLGSFTTSELNTALSDNDVATGGGTASGTNTGDVTLSGTPDYITISGQVITRAAINLGTHVTGDLPFANLTQGSALSVLGVTGNATADVASIAAGSDHNILRRNGTSVAFGSIDLSQSGAVGSSILSVANGGTGVANPVIYLPSVTGYTGSGTSGTMLTATAIDQIPTTSLATGQRISAIVTVSGTQRRLYVAELVTPADATAAIELSPSVIRPNDFNAGTNNKVWRQIRMNGIIDVSNFGVVPDPTVFVSDQINAIITAATSGDALIFPPGAYKIYAITVPNGKPLHFIGFGAKFVFSTVNVPHFVIGADFTTVRGFTFVGQGRAHASYPAQSGIRIISCSNVTISDCIFDSMPNYAIQTNTTHISDQSSDFGGINIVNVLITRSKIGFEASTRGEYVNIVGSSITDCDTGLKIGAGNINVQGCNILDCSTVAIDLVTDVNDAHGVITGNQINHNALAFRGDGIVNGEFIRNNNIYYGDMEFTDCAAIVFTGNTIEGAEVFLDNCTGIVFEGNTLPNNASTTLTTDWNSNPSTVFSFNNRDLDNEFVSGWNNEGAIGLPQLTTTKRDALTASAGMIVYNTSTSAVNFYNGSSWVALGSGTIGGSSGATDNAIITANGTGGATVQSSLATVDDAGVVHATGFASATTSTTNQARVANYGSLGASTTASASIYANADIPNSSVLIADITVYGIKSDGTASVVGKVTGRYRKDSSGTFVVDDAGTSTTSNAAVLVSIVPEINGTNPQVQINTGASGATYNYSFTAICSYLTY